jgi:hypothetical protein
MIRSAVTVVLAGLATAASANGRFPATRSVAVQQGNSSHIIVGTTFGPLISTDSGKTWPWVCDQSVGNLTALDPVFVWTASGTIAAAAWEGLLITNDQGCNWTSHPLFAVSGTTGIAASPTDPNTFFVTTGRAAGADGGVLNSCYVSTDGLSTFSPSLQAANQILQSVVIAPSDANRIYVGAWWYDDLVTDAGAYRNAWIYVSTDGGKTWQPITQTIPSIGELSLLGVNPTNPDILFGVTEADDPVSGLPANHIWRSLDRGQTLTTVLTVGEQVGNMSATNDGQTFWIASLNTVYRSTNAGATFEALPFPTQNACVQYNGGTLYSCGWQWSDGGWEVGTSTDDGNNFEKLFGLYDLTGPMSCPADSGTAQQCPAQWPLLASTLGICYDGGPAQFCVSDGGVNSGSASGCHCGPLGFDPARSPLEALGSIVLVALLWNLRRRNGKHHGV